VSAERLQRPKGLTELIQLLDECNWSYSLVHGKDSNSSPFITVTGVDPASGHQVIATWHSRGTGTLRLFSCMSGISKWALRDVSLKAARADILTERQIEAAS